MGQLESPRLFSDKRVWNRIYGTLKEILKSQRTQIETLINDREFLENYVYLQQEQWCSRSQFLEFNITQMKEEHQRTRLIEDTKMRVFVGFKESEALCYMKQLELTGIDLEDLRSCMEAVSAEMEEIKEKLKAFEAGDNAGYVNNVTVPSKNFKGNDQSVMSLKKEIKKLKHAYKELSSRKNSEVSALLAEKDFVWNQFKEMEDDYISLLKAKRAEADQDKKAIEKLQNSVEKLLLSINEKDDVIAKLEVERATLELDVRKHAEEPELACNKVEYIHSDMDEQHSIEKEAELREDLCNSEGDLKKNFLKNSGRKNKSEGKSQNDSKTVKHDRRGPNKLNLESCDISTSHKRRSSCGVTFQTPAPDNRIHQNLLERKGSASSPAVQSLFHSDFKVPKLKRSTPLVP